MPARMAHMPTISIVKSLLHQDQNFIRIAVKLNDNSFENVSSSSEVVRRNLVIFRDAVRCPCRQKKKVQVTWQLNPALNPPFKKNANRLLKFGA